MTRQINELWTELNDEVQKVALMLKSEELKNIHKRCDELRNKFANLIQMAQEESWPFFAEANGFHLPDDEEQTE